MSATGFDTASLAPRDAYALLTSFILPRPIALVSTLGPPPAVDSAAVDSGLGEDEKGAPNVAPFSYFTGVGSDPPTIALSIGERRDGMKDTLRNLIASGVFCINLVEEAISEAMNATSAELPYGESEFVRAGLTPMPCTAIDCVAVAEARAQLECRLVDTHQYGRKQLVHLVVAEVVYVRIDDAILVSEGTSDGGSAKSRTPRIDPDLVKPVARMGGPNYAPLGARYQHKRPVR